MTEETIVCCKNHPNVETTLRCNHCGEPICAKCAVKTPTGYRCPQCVKSQLKVFDTAETIDYFLGFAVAGFLSGVASGLVGLVSFIGFFGWILLIFVVPFIAGVIAEATRWAVRKHRSKPLFYTILAGVIVGALPVTLLNLLGLNFYGLIPIAIYFVLGVPTVYYRISGIQLFK